MKVKSDFVTNSSSSSFVVLTKGSSTKGDLEKIFENLLGDNKLFPRLAKDISDSFYRAMNKRELGEWLDDYGLDSLTDECDYAEFEIIKENIAQYPNLYSGFFSNEDDVIEYLLCESTIDYKDDEVIIYKESGY